MVTGVDPELSVSGLKKLLKVIVFFWVMNALALTRPMDFLAYLSQRLKISKIRNYIEVRTRSLKNVSPLNILIGIMITAGTLSAAYGIFQGITHPQGIWSRIGVHGSLSNIMTYSVIMMLIASLVLARILFDPRTSKTFLIGTLLFLGRAMILTLIRRSKQIPPDANERWVVLGSAAAVIAFLVAGMFENNFYDSEIIILMYFIMALPFVSYKNIPSAPSDSPPLLTSR